VGEWYDIAAVDRKLEELDTFYRELYRAREELEQRLARAEEALKNVGRSEHLPMGSMDQLRAELAEAEQREQALREKMSRLGPELAKYQRRELLIEELSRSSSQAAMQIRSEARDEATKLLKKAKEREIDLTRSAERSLQAAERTAAAAEQTASRLRRDAEAQASAIVAAARERETQLLQETKNELARAEADRRELRTVWSELRDGLSQMVWALGRLQTTVGDDAEADAQAADGPDDRSQARPPADVAETAASLTSLADAIKARVQTRLDAPQAATSTDETVGAGETAPSDGDHAQDAADGPPAEGTGGGEPTPTLSSG
jgi:chromosome segregation ATPase